MASETILVTGFPATEAKRLVERLLRDEPNSRVALLVYHELVDQAHAALETMVARDRVEVFEGDSAAIDLGLSGTEFRRLTRTVTRIHHIARAVYPGVNRKHARWTNVQGALEVVGFASEVASLNCLVHHSSAFVSGDRPGTIYESELDEGQAFFSESQRTLMEAEKVFRKAMLRLPVTVLRPTMIVGDEASEPVERFAGAYLLVMAIHGVPAELAVPMPFGPHKPIDLVSLDYVVAAAAHVGRAASATGSTLHLVCSEALRAGEVFMRLATEANRRVMQSELPSQLAQVMARAPGIERVLVKPGAVLRQIDAGARYDDRVARRILEPEGIVCPPLDTYLQPWVDVVRRHAASGP